MSRRTFSRSAVIVIGAAGLVFGTVGAVLATAEPAEAGSRPSERQIAGLFDQWNRSLQTGDPKKVADRYASDAVLLPTVSNQVRSDRAEIVDYFEHFLQKKPFGKKVETIVEVLDNNTAIDTGVYEFTLTDPKTGQKSTVAARYTYVYEKRDGDWRIVNHHSSMMPEG
ncbi:SgcJ/EcaC family oxidoreductase [Streptomyces sp. NPDC048659]|uniref:SgcJ/EcaC family oxidoreductase n=1 Tax=Streptomyces sp. NPDC048659 TaxID=3155489 RepID=UPI00341C0CF2